MTFARASALTRYQLALLLGSQRWLPPVLLYAILLGAGWFGGQRLGDSLGWCAAMLVPVCGWLTRAAAGAEPAAARTVLASATGPRRTQLAVLAVALGAGLVLAAAGTAFEAAVSTAEPGRTARTLADGSVAVLVGVLTGTALGALCGPPLVHRGGYGVLGLAALSLAALVAPVSPVNEAVRAVFSSAQAHGHTALPAGPLAVSAVLLAAAAALSARAASR